MTNNNSNRRWVAAGGNNGGGSNVQSDWSQTDTDAADYIKNKPENLSDFTNDEGFITEAEARNYKSFPESWATTGTISDLIDDIAADDDATTGMSYMATVSYSDLPAAMQQAEVQVDVMSDEEGVGKVIRFTVTSSDTEPYHWEYTSAYGASNTWRGWGDVTAVTNSNPTVAWGTNNVIGSVNGTNLSFTMPEAPTAAVTNNAATLSYGATSTLCNIDGTNVTVTMPAATTYAASVTNNAETLNYGATSTLCNIDGSVVTVTMPAASSFSQVQSNWNETDNTSASFIQNKPTIPTVPENIVTGANTSYIIWVGTQAEYDILTPNTNTVYLIKAN